MSIKTYVMRSSLILMPMLYAPLGYAGECDNDTGQTAYVKCAACHSLEEGTHNAGPSLYRILGRKAGTTPGFQFSFALESSGIVWDAKTLNAFLEAPMAYVPGSVMPFAGIRNAEERDALVCWLATR